MENTIFGGIGMVMGFILLLIASMGKRKFDLGDGSILLDRKSVV